MTTKKRPDLRAVPGGVYRQQAYQEPESGPRKKEASGDLLLMIARFKADAKGLDGLALEEEITRFVDKLVEHNAQRVPAHLRPQVRELLYGQLDGDPTLQALLQDLREGAKRL